jgi:Glycosyl transferases group 1
MTSDPPFRPKKVLFFGKTKARTRCTGALVDAMRGHGLEVRWLNCSWLKRYFGKVGMRFLVRTIRKRFEPDMCVVFYHDLPRELMREIATQVPTVVWMEEQTVTDEKHLDYVRDVRLLCLSTPRLVREYRENGIANSTFMLSGFSPKFHAPVEVGKNAVMDRDIAFIGGPGHMGDRPEFLAWLAEHHRVEIFGRIDSWMPYLARYPKLGYARELRASDYGEVCSRSKIVLGLNQDHDSAYYFSNRLFLTLGCRGFHLIRYVPGTENLFADGEHLAWFKDREDCLEKIDYYLEHPEERARIAQSGHDRALAKHRYHHRVGDILEILAGEQDLSCPGPLARDRVLDPHPSRKGGVSAPPVQERIVNSTVEPTGLPVSGPGLPSNGVPERNGHENA